MTAEDLHSKLENLATQGPFDTDKLAFDTFKHTWVKLRFSLVHLSMFKEETVQEFYQVWYESYFSVWKELSMVFDPQNKFIHTMSLVFGLYLTY